MNPGQGRAVPAAPELLLLPRAPLQGFPMGTHLGTEAELGVMGLMEAGMRSPGKAVMIKLRCTECELGWE